MKYNVKIQLLGCYLFWFYDSLAWSLIILQDYFMNVDELVLICMEDTYCLYDISCIVFEDMLECVNKLHYIDCWKMFMPYIKIYREWKVMMKMASFLLFWCLLTRDKWWIVKIAWNWMSCGCLRKLHSLHGKIILYKCFS